MASQAIFLKFSRSRVFGALQNLNNKNILFKNMFFHEKNFQNLARIIQKVRDEVGFLFIPSAGFHITQEVLLIFTYLTIIIFRLIKAQPHNNKIIMYKHSRYMKLNDLTLNYKKT